MTQAKLAEKIIDIVRWDEDEETFDGVMAFLSVLKPKDMNRFAKWGNPEDHSTPEKCWQFTDAETIKSDNNTIFTKEDMEKAYRAGENKRTYYFKDTTVILPTSYEGIDG